MSRSSASIKALVRVARIRSDMELKRFAAFRVHVAAIDARIGDLQQELLANAEGAVAAWSEPAPAPATPADPLRLARLAHGLARSLTVEREAAAAERARITPRFEVARTEAVRAFGRAAVLDQIATDMAKARRQDRDKRHGGT